MRRFWTPARFLPIALAAAAVVLLPGCDPDQDRLTLRDVDRYTPALLQEALEPSWHEGRIHHPILTGHYREALELFAETLDGHGERSRPSLFRFDRQRIAYHANAHNGLALLAWLEADAAGGDPTLTWDPAWSTRLHAVDGEMLSLDDLADRVRDAGGREAELLLSRGRLDSPGFPEVPFEGRLFEGQRGTHLRFLFNQEDLFRATSGAVVGPAWLRLLTEERPEAPPPLTDSQLASLLDTHLSFGHPLRLEILRAAREGTLVLADEDPRIAPGTR